MAVDYINTLGAGAGFNTKEIVTALVEAERAPKETRLQNKIEGNEAQISALGQATSDINAISQAANLLEDKSDFNVFNTSNSQTSAFSVSANSEANEGSHSITVSTIAREQRTNITPDGASEFTSTSQSLNSGNAFDLTIVIGSSSTVSHTVSVTTATPQGIVDAVNAAGIDVTAQLLDQGTTGTNYLIQLTGKSGAENQFSITPSVNSVLSSNTPSGSSAADASVVVNGVTFTRSDNSINDIIPGLQLDLNSVTSGAASVSVTQDTTTIESNIRALVEAFNNTKASIDALTNREEDGALAGDSIFRQSLRAISNLFTNASSTPGTTLSSLSDLGISINRTGTLEISDAKLDSALTSNFNDIRKLFSADTEDQTSVGEANRGIAGDLTKMITDLTSSTGYLTRQTATLESGISDYEVELENLEEKMQKVQERYTSQFASMNALIEELNNTKDNLISSFDNLPFTNRDR